MPVVSSLFNACPGIAEAVAGLTLNSGAGDSASTECGTHTLTPMSEVNQAIGVLIAGGRSAAQGRAELHRSTAQSGTSTVELARRPLHDARVRGGDSAEKMLDDVAPQRQWTGVRRENPVAVRIALVDLADSVGCVNVSSRVVLALPSPHLVVCLGALGQPHDLADFQSYQRSGYRQWVGVQADLQAVSRQQQCGVRISASDGELEHRAVEVDGLLEFPDPDQRRRHSHRRNVRRCGHGSPASDGPLHEPQALGSVHAPRTAS